MRIPQKFRYNPKYHCWPAIWKAIACIMVFTLLLVAIEAPAVYEIKKALYLTNGYNILMACVCAIINSLLLRRYVIILKKRNAAERGEPRFACHAFIWLFSLFFILVANNIEHDARADMYHSKTLDGLKFNEAEYFYIDSPPQLDTARMALNIKYNHYTKSRGLATEHTYTGCYVAPFRGFGDVFYVVEHEYSRSTDNIPIPSKYTEKDIWEGFQKEFTEMLDSIKPTINNHLFQRLRPELDDYVWPAVNHTYERDTIYHGISYSYRAVILNPVKHDRMPRWTDKLPITLFILVLYFLVLLMVFGCSKTVPFPDDNIFYKPKSSRLRR